MNETYDGEVNQVVGGDITVGYDDPTNASGLSAPAILRGTVNLHLCAGVTKGAGQTNTVRGNTLTGLQNGVNYAISNGKFIECEPGIYEIYGSAGLVLTASGVSSDNFSILWRGSKQSRIVQCYANAPCVSIGDNTAYSWFIDVDGLRAEYGVSQTGNTNANTLVLGGLAHSNVRNIQVGCPYGTYGTFPNTPSPFPGYRGVYHYCPTVGGSFTSNFDDFSVQGFQVDGVNWATFIEGVNLRRWYIANGNNSYPTLQPGSITGSAFVIGNGVQESCFEGINIEAVYANILVNFAEARSLDLFSWHFEGDFLSGSFPCFFQSQFGQVQLIGCTVQNCNVTTSNLTNQPRFITAYGGELWTVDGLKFEYDYASYLNTAMPIFYNDGPADSPLSVKARNLWILDSGGGNQTFHQLDGNLARANFNMPNTTGEYQTMPTQAKTTGAIISVSATYTHYGCMEDAFILVPASVTSFTLTLAETMFPSTPGSSLLPRTGSLVHFRRLSGTASGTVTIKSAANSITGGTNTAAATDIYFEFSGTHWVVVT